MGRILFIPVSIVAGLLAALVSKKAVDFVWARVSDREIPEPEHRDVSWPQLAAALALEGAIFRLSRGLIEHLSRRGFLRTTGRWPGEEQPEAS
jgi:Protein of unknown function (DUF4235)